MTPFETILLLLGVALLLADFSFVWFGASVAFDIAESIIIGAAITLNIINVYNSLRTSAFTQITTGNYWLLIPCAIGILAFARVTRYRWLARYPIAIMSGVGVGIVTGPLIRSQILDFTITNIQGVITRQPDIYSAVLILVGGAFALTYFLYSMKFSNFFHKGQFSFMAKIGRYFLYAGFGYLYAKIFIDEGIDALTNILMIGIRRTVDALITGIYA